MLSQEITRPSQHPLKEIDTSSGVDRDGTFLPIPLAYLMMMAISVYHIEGCHTPQHLLDPPIDLLDVRVSTQ